MRRITVIAAIAALSAVFAPIALAATATPFGGATVSGGILTLVSNTGDTDASNDVSGVRFTETGVTTFASLTTLSTEFDVTDDDCLAGSPRFQVRVQTSAGEKNVFVYLGPTPSFTGCSKNIWISSGNLIGSTEARFETAQVQSGGPLYKTYAEALAVVGSLPVTGISLVVDSGYAFADKEQTVRVRNVRVNGSTFHTGETTPHGGRGGLNPAQACKKLRAEMGTDAFKLRYGTNANRSNAYGKCVSAMARMKSPSARATAVTRIHAAAARCAKLTVAASKGKGKGKAKGVTKHASLAACLEKAS